MINKKKVGIVTCSKESNYGACLQAFATQQVLYNNGYDAEILNYSLEPEVSYTPFKQSSIRSLGARLLFYSLRKKQYLAFEEFHESMKFSSNRLRNANDYFIAKDNYDILLVGSDQVWNPYLGFDLDLSLLRFYDDGPSRISYATSFGVTELPEELENKYASALRKFDFISTREEQGSAIIEKLLDRRPKVVLDPTMLITADEWEIHAKHYDNEERYVLIYDQNHSQELIPIAKKIAKSKYIKIFVLSAIFYRNSEFFNLQGIAPDLFLDIVRKAEYVVTDSFHGAVFSIIFHKQFSVCCGGNAVKLKSRIINLLAQFHLEDRWINDENVPNEKEIDYDMVESILSQGREESMHYLIDALEGCGGGKVSKDNHCKTSCSGCGLCVELCPVDAIKMYKDEEGFDYSIIDSKICIKCGVCYKSCPHLSYKPKEAKPSAYIARSNDRETLLASSSGGLFTEISDYFFRHGDAVVYGAAFDDAFSVKHIRATTSKERDLMRGSKYIQSDLRAVFCEIESDLSTGRKVLFTGTPCQCMAIKEYVEFKKLPIDDLTICDVICHGISSNEVWHSYLHHMETNLGHIESIRFRNKKYDDGYYMTIQSDNKTYAKKDVADPFIYIFSHNLAIRPSCINCKFKSLRRVSDITIGDFQKAKEFYPEYCDGLGSSVVLINSHKGRILFDCISEKLQFIKCPLDHAMQINLMRNTVPTPQRNGFMNDYSIKGYEYAVHKYTEENRKKHFIGEGKRFIKRILKKLWRGH